MGRLDKQLHGGSMGRRGTEKLGGSCGTPSQRSRKKRSSQRSAFFAGRLKEHPWRATRRSEKGCFTPTPKQELFGQDFC